jgi:hypothetical protein
MCLYQRNAEIVVGFLDEAQAAGLVERDGALLLSVGARPATVIPRARKLNEQLLVERAVDSGGDTSVPVARVWLRKIESQ